MATRTIVATCPNGQFAASTGLCVPEAWTCTPLYFGTRDGCDCDCGAPDPDCTQGAPAFCYNAGKAKKASSCAVCASVRP